MHRQSTPAELVAAIVEADDRPLYRIESEAGIAHGAIRAWMGGRQCPVLANVLALAEACDAEVVVRRRGGGE